jgi:hypothetical protein
MAADLHLVDAGLAMIDRRDAVLDPGREHEVGDRAISLGLLQRFPRPVRGLEARSDSFVAEKENLGSEVAFARFLVMG